MSSAVVDIEFTLYSAPHTKVSFVSAQKDLHTHMQGPNWIRKAKKGFN